MMKSFTYLAPLAIVGSSVAQHVYFEPREAQSSMGGEFHQYDESPGPSPTASVQAPPTETWVAPYPTDTCGYWLEEIKHQGIAAFNPDPGSYQVFRNVKDFGAKGDGVTDDTAAINNAISSGARCAPGSCNSTTVTPAVVYFPLGMYMISASITDYYYTQMIGNPNCLPTIRALSNYSGGAGMIDGDRNGTNGLEFASVNVFWRQIRNFIIDTTLLPASSPVNGIHWPTAQATSIQNVVFQMSSDAGTQHQGIYIELGSGGLMTDLIFNGGLNCVVFGNQQFTMRNLTFNNAVTAISQVFDWGWTYKSISINNCSVGLNMSTFGSPPGNQTVGSLILLDSSITNTPIGILTSHSPDPAVNKPPAGGSLIIENVVLNNVSTAVLGANGITALAGTAGLTTIAAWGEGHEYTPNGPTQFEGPITPFARPGSLLQGSKYYERSKPQYEQYPLNTFVSARSSGATGDGHTDDTAALQKAILTAQAQGKILFVDHGDYIITTTLYVPAGSRIVGETYSVILSQGQYFNNMESPKPVVQLGHQGECGIIEWSDMIVSTQGQQEGAILIEWNIASPSNSPSGMWDVHARIGGFAGSNLQLAQCPTTPKVEVSAANLNKNCIAAYLTMHVTKGASGLYFENVWLWVADHDAEDSLVTSITVYAGRGLLIESQSGTLWLYGTSVEHHQRYQYQFANTKDIYAGQIQTETAYWQPNPNANLPFPASAPLNDPTFEQAITPGKIPAAEAWGLRILNSESVLIYGAGLYSFFDNYVVNCSNKGNGAVCQNRIFSLEGGGSNNNVYNLNTVGAHNQITKNGVDLAVWSDNVDAFIDTIALFRSG